MAEIVRYVNTDSTPGGDGTTNDTTGANRAWATMFEAEAALDNSYDGDYVTLNCSAPSGTDDTTAVTFNGATFVDPDNDYIDVVGEVSKAEFDDTEYVIHVEDSAVITIWDDAIRLSKLQISLHTPTTTRYVVDIAALAADNNIQINKCIIKSAADNSYIVSGIHINDADAVVRIGINLIYNGGEYVNYSNSAIYIQASANVYAYYNTLVDYTGSIYHISGTAVFKNNVLYSSSLNNVFGGGTFTGSDYNMSDDATDTGGGNDDTGVTFTFVGGGSYALDSSDAGAKEKGTPLHADANFPISDDIAGTTRDTTNPDCGCYEITGGAPPTGATRFGGLKGKALSGSLGGRGV